MYAFSKKASWLKEAMYSPVYFGFLMTLIIWQWSVDGFKTVLKILNDLGTKCSYIIIGPARSINSVQNELRFFF